MRPHADPLVEATLEELEANRAMFRALCRACTSAQLGRRVPGGQWTALEHVAHLASFDALALRSLAARHDRLPGPGSGLDADAWNDQEVTRRAGRPLAALLREMEALRAQSEALLAAATPAVLAREVAFPGDARRAPAQVPLRLWLRLWSKHDLVHARAILRVAPTLASHPDFQAWLAEDPYLEAWERAHSPGRGP